MKKILIVMLLLMSLGKAFAAKRGLWVWNTTGVIGTTTEVYRIINQCKNDGITDIYIWSHALLKNATRVTQMKAFISMACCNNIRVWALDGDRGYLQDASGPASYYDFLNDVINYNTSASACEKFYGVHADIEPQDGQMEPRSSFHNDIKDSDLNASGGGVWQTTEVLDREMLMRGWLDIAQQSFITCHANNLYFGMAMPSWMDDYYGEPVKCTYNAVYKPVYQHMMPYVDDYCIMSYRTTPANVITICAGELTYADGISPRPEVWAGLETHCGVGAAISYCDAPGKNTKAAFWTDVAIIEANLGTHISYAGMNIHDWQGGWQSLSPAATNTTNPGCTALPVTYLSIKGAVINGAPSLEWITLTEINSQVFEIQQMQDDGHFVTIAEINAAGNSSELNTYTWTGSPTVGIVYLRIKQIDLDDQYSYSAVVTLNIASLTGWNVYSSGEQIHVVNPENHSLNLNLTFYNTNGQLIKDYTLQVSPASATSYEPGLNPSLLYLVRASEYNSGKVVTLKFKTE